MTASFRKPSLLSPGNATLVLPLPSPFTARVRTPPRAANRGPGPETREHRRTVRTAGLAVRQAATPSAAAQLRAHATAVKDSPAEERWFAVLMALALIGAAWGMADAFRFVERWPHFVAFVRQLIG